VDGSGELILKIAQLIEPALIEIGSLTIFVAP
jgi:hypothetical protein